MNSTERSAGIEGIEGLDNLLVLDRMNELSERDVLYSFALDEWLCRHTGRGGPAICHLWRHPRAFIMGLRDSRLPHAAEAARWLEAQGYETAVRHSGGAAVPLDLGVVNVSLILPKPSQGDLHFHRDFERMYQLIRHALLAAGRTVDKGEVAGAYCPGDYDLSIGGLKFCGIAQRRQSHAFIVQAFVICSGSGQDSAQLVRQFYDRATHGADEAAVYPRVATNSTASLDELIGLGSDANGDGDAPHRFASAVKQVIRAQQSADGLAEASGRLLLPDSLLIREMAAKLRERYGLSN